MVTEASVVFFDDFEDGTLSPWSQLQSGVVSIFDDPVDGRVLRKSVNGDPDGGLAPLGGPVSDFELVLYTRKVVTTSNNSNPLQRIERERGRLRGGAALSEQCVAGGASG